MKAALDQGSPLSWALAYKCLIEAQSMRPEVRKYCDQVIADALESGSMATFEPAARAFHVLRQRESRRVADELEQRLTMVSQCEYELFVLNSERRRAYSLVPPHCASVWFQNDAAAPILGVYGWQATAFAEAISDDGSGWRLPNAAEVPALQADRWRFWYVDENRNYVLSHSSGGASRVDSSARAFEWGVGERKGSYGFPWDLESALSRVFTFPVLFNLPLALTRLLELALHRLGFIYLSDERLRFLFGDLRLSGVELTDNGIVHDVSLRISQIQAEYGGTSTSDVEQLYRQMEDESSNKATRLRANLLIRLHDIETSEEESIERRDAWVRFSSFLFTLGLSHMRGKERGDAAAIAGTLWLVEERRAGKSMPQEGILLVRDAVARP